MNGGGFPAPPRRAALAIGAGAAGLAETAGGGLLLAGLATPLGAGALTAEGPGSPSLDEAPGIARNGTGWALAELASGVAGAAAMPRYAEDQGEAPADPTSAAPAEMTQHAPEPAGAPA